MTLADLLIELRTARGLSQEDLAARTGVSVRAIGDLERGATRRPHRETVRALADGLGLGADERAGFERAARTAPPPATRPRTGRAPALPAPVSSIVGRDADLAALGRLVRDRSVRLITVTGPGGVGKTRLATEAGWRFSASFERVNGVDLSPLGRPDDVPQALASAIGCRTAGVPPVDAVMALIGGTRWLLVLDSFEHVAGAATVLADLLAGCPRLTAVVTSRAPLLLRGEHVWPLAPLPLPPADPDRADPADLAANPAIALLVQRTCAVRPGFQVQPGNAADLARLCRRLDGLPLAIELAAAQLRIQEPAQLAAQLESRFTTLAATTVDVPTRHQTLRRAVEWSTERLAAPDRALLGVLAVFRGGATPAAVRAILGDPALTGTGAGTGTDPDASVSLLAASSLVTIIDRAGEARITMLDTIRETALDLLVAAGRDAAVRGAHARYFLDLVREAPAAGLDRVDGELDNVRAALDRAVAREPDLLDAPLVRGLTAFYFARGQFVEAGRLLSAVAEAAPIETARAVRCTAWVSRRTRPVTPRPRWMRRNGRVHCSNSSPTTPGGARR
jgi:predicted ATPase/DNA-binding XRE family transcriptional regulator